MDTKEDSTKSQFIQEFKLFQVALARTVHSSVILITSSTMDIPRNSLPRAKRKRQYISLLGANYDSASVESDRRHKKRSWVGLKRIYIWTSTRLRRLNLPLVRIIGRNQTRSITMRS